MLYAIKDCSVRQNVVDNDAEETAAPAPTRSQVADYVHDIAGQLAVMAKEAGLPRTAEGLLQARSILEAEF